jgi:hypothetical protein
LIVAGFNAQGMLTFYIHRWRAVANHHRQSFRPRGRSAGS